MTFNKNQSKINVRIGVALVFLIVVLSVFSTFLNKIEQREGIVLKDILLEKIPCIDLSTPIFFIIWTCSIIAIIYFFKNKSTLLVFVWSYAFLCLSRIITIQLVALNPPTGIVELADPLTNLFYGGKFLTKDLFYSGHTSTIFLMGLVIQKKWIKYLLFMGSAAIGTMVLFQHVHYTIDVLAAPIFGYLVYRLGKKVACY